MHRLKKNIITNKELENKELIKEYLEYSFKNRKTKKNQNLYINICIIFHKYPVTIKKILDNIPILGYYKDYFYILSHSKNDELNTHIYNHIVNQLNEDLRNLAVGNKISTLGKWLPREKSKLNLNCNFIDNFNKLFFPQIKNKITARSEYRKIKTLINKKLGTIEPILCGKQYQSIDYNKIAPYAFKQKKKLLIKHPQCEIALFNYETDLLEKMTMSEFIKEILLKKHCILNTYNNTKLHTIWEQNEFYKKIPFMSNIINNSVCVADLSNDIYNINGEFFTLGIILLIEYYSNAHMKIMIGKDNVNLKGTIIEKINQLLKYIGPQEIFDIKYYHEVALKGNNENNENNENIIKYNENNENNDICLIFITTKEIEYDIEYLARHKLKFMQIVPCHNTYNVIYHDGTKLIMLENLVHCTYNYVKSDKKIYEITKGSSELNNGYSIIIGCGSILLIMFLMYYYF